MGGNRGPRGVARQYLWTRSPRADTELQSKVPLLLACGRESLESVVGNDKARLKNGYICTMVASDYFLIREEEREERSIQKGRIARGQYLNTDSELEEEGEIYEDYSSDDEEEEEEQIAGEVRERVNVYELVSLYSYLLLGGRYHLHYDFKDELYYVL